MRLWHFTSVLHLPLIIEDGFLKPTETNLHPVIDHDGPDAVWFLDGPDLGGVLHGLTDGLPGDIMPDKTQVRFEVEVPAARVIRWLPWAEAQGIDSRWRDVLMDAAGGREGAERWCVVFRKVPAYMWQKVEVKMDGAWTTLAESTMEGQ